MKAERSLAFALISVMFLSATVPAALAEEAGTERNDAANVTGGSSTAVGHVYVTLVEWKPDLEGLGTGMFTYSAFDFEEFFGKLAEAFSSLFGL